MLACSPCCCSLLFIISATLLSWYRPVLMHSLYLSYNLPTSLFYIHKYRETQTHGFVRCIEDIFAARCIKNYGHSSDFIQVIPERHPVQSERKRAGKSWHQFICACCLYSLTLDTHLQTAGKSALAPQQIWTDWIQLYTVPLSPTASPLIIIPRWQTQTKCILNHFTPKLWCVCRFIKRR